MELVSDKYKKTELGTLPEDWDIIKLGDLGEVIIGLTYSPENVAEYGTLVLRSSNIQNNQLAYQNNVFVKMQLPERVIVREGDILICVRNGSRNLIGKSAVIDKYASGFAFGAFMALFRSESNFYVAQLFQSNIIQRQIENNLGATINQITNKDLKSFKVPFPPTKSEQTAIATALSDMDALISSLEKLIEKKKMIKQGAMQELLKPKEGWVVKRLGEIGRCYRGVSYNPERDLHIYDKEITVRLLRSNNIQNDNIDLNGLQYVNKERVKPNQILQKNDIVICMANGSKQLVGKAAIFKSKDHLKYTYGAFMACFRTNINLASSSYISLNFQSFKYRNFIDVLLSGSSINNLNTGNIESIEIPFPSPDEQSKIATILSDMDAEITALEYKLEKKRKIKLGMMQNLLTGKVRLI